MDGATRQHRLMDVKGTVRLPQLDVKYDGGLKQKTLSTSFRTERVWTLDMEQHASSLFLSNFESAANLGL